MNQNANSIGIFTENVSQVGCPSCQAELDVSEFQVFEEISCPACGEKFQVPGRLGDFILIEELGRGAMGCVYLAMDESLNRLVALKVIRKEFGEDPKMLETVQREAQAMATLNHRNIVQVYSFGRIKEQPYFVMELLTGERLDEMISGSGTVEEVRTLEIMLDVAHGLSAADQAGLTHGDIKPANILMNEEGVAKVVDFGLAKFMEPGAEIEVWGTPYYIAPEKARKKGEDSRSDQYSLAATMFHAMTGHTPFDGETPTKVVVAALKQPTPSLKEHNPEVTEKTSQMLMRMMDKNPNRRYPTYASLLADLEAALAGAKAARAEHERIARLERERANKKVSPLIWILALVTLLMLGGIGVVWWQLNRERAPVEAIYDGPARALHEPFIRAEERNLRQAVDALLEENYGRTLERLEVARNLIPDNHNASAWLSFMAAGMHLYAQNPERAREELTAVVERSDMIFDGGRPPREDPRLLASFALGTIDERDLERGLRRTEPYFVHLAKLARGYRMVLDGQASASARHFRYYAAISSSSRDWAYILQPLGNEFHLPRQRMLTEEETQAVLETRASELLDGLGIRTSEGNPFFRISPFSNERVNIRTQNRPDWQTEGGWTYARIEADNALTNARGLQPRTGRTFTLLIRLRWPAGSQQNSSEPGVVAHFGGFSRWSRPDPVGSGPVSGLVLELPPGDTDDTTLRVRMGLRGEELHSETFDAAGIRPGTVQVVGLSWDGFRSGPEEPEFSFEVTLNGNRLFSLDLSDAVRQPDETGFNLVAFGAGIGDSPELNWGGERVQVRDVFVVNRALSSDEIVEFIADRIR